MVEAGLIGDLAAACLGVPITVFIKEKSWVRRHSRRPGGQSSLIEAFEAEAPMRGTWRAQGAFPRQTRRRSWQKVDDILDVWSIPAALTPLCWKTRSISRSCRHPPQVCRGSDMVAYLEGSDQHRVGFILRCWSLRTRGRALRRRGHARLHLDESGYKMSKSLGNVSRRRTDQAIRCRYLADVVLQHDYWTIRHRPRDFETTSILTESCATRCAGCWAIWLTSIPASGYRWIRCRNWNA